MSTYLLLCATDAVTNSYKEGGQLLLLLCKYSCLQSSMPDAHTVLSVDTWTRYCITCLHIAGKKGRWRQAVQKGRAPQPATHHILHPVCVVIHISKEPIGAPTAAVINACTAVSRLVQRLHPRALVDLATADTLAARHGIHRDTCPKLLLMVKRAGWCKCHCGCGARAAILCEFYTKDSCSRGNMCPA